MLGIQGQKLQSLLFGKLTVSQVVVGIVMDENAKCVRMALGLGYG